MREDRVFWGVLVVIVIVVLLSGAVVAVRRGTTERVWEYRPDESRPENVVYNAYVAAVRDDMDRFLGYFVSSPFGEFPGQPTGVRHLHVAFVDQGELRIGSATVEGDKARVPVYLLREYGPPLFGTRVHVTVEHVHLKRVDGRWRIDDMLPGVYPEWSMVPIPLPPGEQPGESDIPTPTEGGN